MDESNLQRDEVAIIKVLVIYIYIQGFPNIMSTIRSCLPTLLEDPQCMELFPQKASGLHTEEGMLILRN